MSCGNVRSVILRLFLLLFVLLATETLYARASPGSALHREVLATEDVCVVSGTVINRLDKTPLQGARVQLFGEENPEDAIATKTDPDGRFKLTNVRPGTYRMKVIREGYVEQEYGQKLLGYPGASFTLAAGQHISDLVFKLARTGVIAGRIFDKRGEPIAGAMVSALREVYVQGRKQFGRVDMEASNDLGEYRLYGLPPHRYIVSAEFQESNQGFKDEKDSNDKYVETGNTRTYFPNALEAEHAPSLILRDGDEISGIDIRIQQSRVYRIRGRVINAAPQQGIHQVQLIVMRDTDDMAGDIVGSQIVSKPDGSFELTGMVPGHYSLLAQLFDAGKRYSAEEEVELENASPEGLTLTIGISADVTGRIHWEKRPSLEGHQLTIMASPIHFGGGWGIRARVNADLHFSLKDMPQGKFHLVIDGLPKDCYIKEFKQGESVLQDEDFIVSQGAASPLDITISSRGARVRGIVTSADNLPMVGAAVVAVPQKGNRKLHRLYKLGTSDQHGRFELRGLAPGKYTLFSWDEVERGAWEDEDFLKPFEDQGVAIEVFSDDDKETSLKLIQLHDGLAKIN
jgi:hypothetical protein